MKQVPAILFFSCIHLLLKAQLSDKKQDSLLAALRSNTKEDTSRINALLAITEYYISVQKYKELIFFCDEAVKLAQTKQNEIKKPATCYYASFAKYIAGEYENSLTYALRGIDAAKKYPDTRREIKLNAIACKSLMSLERYAQAAAYAFASLKKSEDSNDSLNMAKAFQLISTCFFYQDKFRDALNYTFKAYHFYRSKKLFLNVLETSNGIGEAYLRLNQLSKAIIYYNESLHTIKLLGNDAPPYATANSYSYLAGAYEKQGDSAVYVKAPVAGFYNRAFSFYTQSIRQWEKIDSTKNFGVSASVIGDLKVQAGNLLFKMNRFAQSRKYVSDGILICKQTDSKKALSDAYLVMSKIDSINGNTVLSFNNYKLHVLYRDSIFNTANNRLLEIYRNQNETERRDKEMQLLSSEKKLKSALAQKRKQQLFFAWMMTGLILSGAAFAFYRYRRFSKIKAEQKLLKERLAISQDLHDHVGSTLSSISVFSKVAQIHGGENKKEEMNELLGRIRSTSNTMITEMNDIVWAINPVNDTMEKIIQRMEAYAKPLLEARNIKFNFQYYETLFAVPMEMEKRKNFYLIFKEAINNATKYSAASEVQAGLHRQNGNLVLNIRDNGIGFNAEQTEANSSLSGNGLRNMQARAKAIGGQLKIESSPGSGTSITLTCPL